MQLISFYVCVTGKPSFIRCLFNTLTFFSIEVFDYYLYICMGSYCL